MNITVIMGNIVREPEYRSTQEGTSVCSFTVAVNRNYKDATGSYPADFIPCVAWREKADFVHRYFSKGSSIIVIGELQTRSYTTKNGDKRHITELIARSIEFAGKKEKSETKLEDPAGNELDEFSDLTPLPEGDLPF